MPHRGAPARKPLSRPAGAAEVLERTDAEQLGHFHRRQVLRRRRWRARTSSASSRARPALPATVPIPPRLRAGRTIRDAPARGTRRPPPRAPRTLRRSPSALRGFAITRATWSNRLSMARSTVLAGQSERSAVARAFAPRGGTTPSSVTDTSAPRRFARRARLFSHGASRVAADHATTAHTVSPGAIRSITLRQRHTRSASEFASQARRVRSAAVQQMASSLNGAAPCQIGKRSGTRFQYAHQATKRPPATAVNV